MEGYAFSPPRKFIEEYLAKRFGQFDAAKPGTTGGTTTHNHLGRALVVVQVTLSVLLLCGAVLPI